MKNVEQQVRLDAVPDSVWQVVGDVGNVASWVPAIEASSMDGDVRHATFAGGGGEARERIVFRDDSARSYTYEYLDGPLPLEKYRSTITVHPDGEGSRVVWSAEFVAQDPETEGGLAEAIDEIYAAGLGQLSARFGG